MDKPKKQRRRRSRPPLDERHYRALAMLNAIPRDDINVIARRLGVHRTTLWRWTQRADYKALEMRLKKRMISEMDRAFKQRLHAQLRRGDMRSIEWFIDRI